MGKLAKLLIMLWTGAMFSGCCLAYETYWPEVSGKILRSDGSPIVGARMEMYGGIGVSANTQTDIDGRFRIGPLKRFCLLDGIYPEVPVANDMVELLITADNPALNYKLRWNLNRTGGHIYPDGVFLDDADIPSDRKRREIYCQLIKGTSITYIQYIPIGQTDEPRPLVFKTAKATIILDPSLAAAIIDCWPPGHMSRPMTFNPE